MKAIRVSATEARNNFFNLLNKVLYEDVRVIIEKVDTGKEAVLSLKQSKEEEFKKRMKVLNDTFGIWKDVPNSRIYDDRLRGKRAKAYLKRARKWDV